MASVKVLAPVSQNKHLNLVKCEPQPTTRKEFLLSFLLKKTASENIKNKHEFSVSITKKQLTTVMYR
jgi:hypothetical protein